ncbi:phosphatidylinositol 4-phosphate 5-kinase-like protein 1 isoform X5 [Phyllopteryx taeniolatus]|nr:phosphatidylinositol 4-phosphate 5-kinase-like protein 1 isoform X5 [Phyllopteryx taeniolatus]
MQSVFYPDDRISARYDIKGCEVSRWTDPSPDGCQIIVVLKDLNFEGQYVTLDRQRPWLLRQMEIDTDFLRSLNVLDYSLLLAHQPLQQDERHHALSFASLIARTKRSVNPSTSPACNIPAVPGAVPEDNSVFISSDTDSDSLKRGQTGDGRSGDAHHRTEELPDFEVQNRRLLLNFKNALHVIDGPDQRYFIGIIDIFTVYSLKKRLEYWWKRLRHPGRTFSTVSPQTYCARLCQWVLEHTK